ncbi:PQQ-dependent sugar dehydrogenase [Sphingomonas kyungheensis]|uniref:PQQ-dependent sugar dehydrogenase n=1 Tax=Sphingomonas kyungheensis TaxID=1069987 RepID=A0ABU8H698_9SPHN
MLRTTLIAATGLGLLTGCGGSGGSAGSGAPQPTEQAQAAAAPVNYGNSKPAATKPFRTVPVATFDSPWALAFLPDATMLVTEKPGRLWLVTPNGGKTAVGGVPTVHDSGQGGLLFVATAPGFAQNRQIYLTYAEPGEGGDGLTLARATLGTADGKPALQGLEVLWRQLPRGNGGQFGGYIAFSPDGQSLFLTSGERQRFTPAQDPDQALGKILRLTLDGKPAPGNPHAGQTGAATIAVIDPPANTGAAAKAPVRKVTLTTPNLTPAETWTSGHRNPYGLAFDAQGRLWETEMGPQGGDELNLIEPGRNYGWPLVSYGDNYDGTPIAKPDSRPDLQQPVLYWNPVIAPAGFAFYAGNMFPEWRGSAFVGGLASTALIRLAFDGTSAREAERWDMGARIRAVMAGPDGGLWLLEDGDSGRLLHLVGNRGG